MGSSYMNHPLLRHESTGVPELVFSLKRDTGFASRESGFEFPHVHPIPNKKQTHGKREDLADLCVIPSVT
jgi:hypothetical protein